MKGEDYHSNKFLCDMIYLILLYGIEISFPFNYPTEAKSHPFFIFMYFAFKQFQMTACKKVFQLNTATFSCISALTCSTESRLEFVLTTQ